MRKNKGYRGEGGGGLSRGQKEAVVAGELADFDMNR